MQQLATQYPEHIYFAQLAQNSGVAQARNFGTFLAQHNNVDFVAFLDADDAYEEGALEVAAATFYFQPETQVVRLDLKPVHLAPRYAQHEHIDLAWQYMRMTGAGNTVFNKTFFAACGGFPTDDLFRELGGEDGALGIATTKVAKVATLFKEAGVLYFCREGMHAERLLDAILFDKKDPRITPDKIAQADAVTESICTRINALKKGLNSDQIGVFPQEVKR
ncbi:glycosyltransferase family A protein [Pelistega ratti]|uniref:glycosyltransferase family A protein n=1 Tax=Pelistega ratti TaxID=2652177 RepID=UPI001FA9DCF5|nr:glycosyltransferase family A protein [Pelistega ratti]